MSGTRADRLERLHRLKGRLREIEEARLGALNAQAAGIAADAQAILESLSDRSPLSGLFLEAKAQRLRRREAERAAVLAAAALVQAKMAEAGASEKRVERVALQARAQQRAADEGRSLADILDADLVRRGASLE